MTPHEWGQIKHFAPSEKWGDPEMMDFYLLQGLDALREYIKFPIHINRGFGPGSTPDSKHPLGKATDCCCPDMPLFEFFLAATRFPVFRGVGVYPEWNRPGLHLDSRLLPGHLSPRAMWGFKNGKIVALNRDFFSLSNGRFW
jgi:uncharacterized protein YcbK (DUF882 family)